MIDPLLAVRLLAFVHELLELEHLARRTGAVEVADAMRGVADAAAAAIDAAVGL